MTSALKLSATLAFAILLLSAPGTLSAAGNEGIWSVAAQMTAARTEIGGVALNGKIYLAGGQEMGRPDSTLFQVFDPAAKTWKNLAPMPGGASHIGMAVLDGKIYVAGGFTVRPHVDPIDRFAVYDPAANKWQVLAPLPMALGSVTLAATQGKIHALGGRRAGEMTVDMHAVYDPVSAKWSMAAPLPTPRDHLGVVVISGKIHLIAGRVKENTEGAGEHIVYDPATDKWSSLAGIEVGRSGGSAVYYHGRIIFYGGECRTTPPRGAFDLVDSYDSSTDHWTPLTNAPVGLHAQAGAVVGDTVYFLGGSMSCGSDKPSLAVYAFRLN